MKKTNKRERTTSEDLENSDYVQTAAITSINSPGKTSSFQDKNECIKMFIFQIDEHNDGASCSIASGTPRHSPDEINNKETSYNKKTKFCTACRHEFSHRSAYLRHIKNIHNGIVPSIFEDDVLTKVYSMSLCSKFLIFICFF